MKRTSLLLIALSSLFLAGQAAAVPIVVISPENSEAQVGSEIDVLISMTNLTGELIGAFDLSLLFDDSVVSATNVFFGTALDGPADSIQGSYIGPGNADAFEISLGFLFEQDGFTDFLLFGVTLDVVGEGLSSLGANVFEVGDYFGLPLDVSVQGSEFRGTAATAVPEPGTLALLTLGLLGLAFFRRRQNAKIQ